MKLLRGVQTVIVADDDREVLWALWRTFQGEPYQDLTTDSPEQALRWVRETPVSLVLIVHRMPEMDGIELFEAVADESPRTARVLLTAYPERMALLPGIARRLDGFVSKPWDSTLL
ncbi:MAG TPA: response regulator [Planctomycetota bacterium]|nr:response regulator [Planctomycetota bacterium]